MWNMIKGLIRIDVATATEWDEGRTQFIVLLSHTLSTARTFP